MNDFITITNNVIEDKLKGKFNLSSVEYSVIDGMFKIRVIFYTLDFARMGFSFVECSEGLDKELLKWKFEMYIDECMKK